jgi:hypothetical protein
MRLSYPSGYSWQFRVTSRPSRARHAVYPIVVKPGASYCFIGDLRPVENIPSREPLTAGAPESAAGHVVGDSVFLLRGSSHIGTTWHAAPGAYVTDNHVISEQSQLFVIDHDGRFHRMGADVWVDPAHDLAVVTPLTPETMPASAQLKLASPSAILPHTKLTGFGFPEGYGELIPKAIPTEFLGVRTSRDAIMKFFAAAKARGETVNDDAAAQVQDMTATHFLGSLLDADLVETPRAGIERGVSGGPIATIDKQVVSVARRIDAIRDIASSTPAENVADLLEHPEQFKHFSGHYENGLQVYATNFQLDPRGTIRSTGIDMAGILGGANRAMRWTPSLAKTGTFVAGLALANDTYANAMRFTTFADARDKWKNGTALAGDVSMIAGLALSFGPAPLRLAAKVLGATGLGTRLGAELIPNYYSVNLPKIESF